MKLSEFIQEYIKKQGISQREFAKQVGVQHRTINSYINSHVSPTLHSLTLLSRATGVGLLTLIAMIAPDDVGDISPDAMRLADRINKLPGVYREAVITMIMNLPLNNGHDSINKS